MGKQKAEILLTQRRKGNLAHAKTQRKPENTKKREKAFVTGAANIFTGQSNKIPFPSEVQ
jgi:hypothetical protein